MKRIIGIVSMVLVSLVLTIGCGADSSSDAESIMTRQADITQSYLDGLEKAGNADDVVKAIQAYTKGMKDLIPDIKAFQAKYPEYKQGKVPEDMEADVKKLEEISARLPGAMMKVASYMGDPEVQRAMTEMGSEMSKLQ